MSVVRRGSVGAVVAGLVLLGGPAWAQEDPCAPGPDGSVPEMCQSGMPVSDTGTVGMEPEAPQEECLGQPVEPGDGVVTDGGDQGIAVGEPNPGTPPSDVEEERVDPEQVDPATVDDAQRGDGTISDDGLICAFGGVPVSAPGGGVPDSAAGGGAESAAGGVTAVEQLPRTGPYDRLLALTALGSGLVVVGAGALAAGRRRTS